MTIKQTTRLGGFPTASGAAARDRKRLADENAELRAENARVKQEAAEQKHKDDCQTIALLNAQAAGLDRADAVRVVNNVESARRRHVADPANAGRTFDVYRVVRERVASIKGTLGPTPVDSRVLEQLLPPPAQAGTRLPVHDPRIPGAEDAARLDAERRAASERGQRLADQDRHGRDAYTRRLRELGLTDPTLGAPGGHGGGGLGM